MIQWIAAVFLVVGFIFVIRQFRLVEKTKEVVAVSRRSLEIIRNSSLDDKSKESALQKNAKQLFGFFFLLAFGGAAAILLPLGVVGLFVLAGLTSFKSVLDIVFSTVFIIISGICIVFAFFFQSKRQSENK